MPLTLSLLFFFTLKGMPLRAQLVFFSNCQFCHFCNNWLFCCPWSQLHFAHTNNFFGINNTKKSVAKCLKKNSTKRFTFSWTSLRKVANNNSSLTLTFSFKKKLQKVGFSNKWGSFFFFLFPHFPEKRVPRGKLFWLFFLNENIVRFGVRTKATKKKQEELASPCFFFCPKTALLQERQQSF